MEACSGVAFLECLTRRRSFMLVRLGVVLEVLPTLVLKMDWTVVWRIVREMVLLHLLVKLVQLVLFFFALFTLAKVFALFIVFKLLIFFTLFIVFALFLHC